MSLVTKSRSVGLVLGLGGCVALVSAASASGVRSGAYTATRPVPGVAHTSMTVTASRTVSTITITTSNPKILADVAGQTIDLQCETGDDRSATAPGVTTTDVTYGVWRKGSSALRLTLPEPLLSGKTGCGTSVSADHGIGPQTALFADFQITAPPPVTVVRYAAAYLDPATSFQLSGSELTVTSRNPQFLKTVRGHTVFGFCLSGVANVARNDRVGPYKVGVVTVVGPKLQWAARAQSATITLPANISHDVDSCQFGAPPEIRAVGKAYISPPNVRASFDAAGTKFIAEAHTLQLTRVHEGLEQAYRLAESELAGAHRWPSGTALVKALTRASEKLQWSYTSYVADISDVTAVGTMYVVAAGTHGAALEFAEIDDYGVTHTLTVSIGGRPHVSADQRGRV